MVELAVVTADVVDRPCDLLVLKFADGFYGADSVIAKRLGFSGNVANGEATFLRGDNIAARKVVYIGVGPLQDFRYREMRIFARRSLELAARGSGRTKVLCTTIHGPGYGLDEREAFLSLVGGFWDGIEEGAFPAGLERIEIVELTAKRAQRLERILIESEAFLPQLSEKRIQIQGNQSFRLQSGPHESLSSFGAQSEQKTKLFVAMPFASEHSDVWDIAIKESCHLAQIVCERVDKEAYVGDILSQIVARLKNANGVLALLDDANPNVFLEIGFAWGAGKPTVLIAKDGVPLPFDVRGHKCIQYTSIANLRSRLTDELRALKAQGIFDS
jgi:hypothetical protein